MKPSITETLPTEHASSEIKAIPLPPRLLRLYGWLTSTAPVFYVMPLLMVLLLAGTIAQRYIGLYEAQKTYFSSVIFWLGPVPLPGAYTLIALMTAALTLKFIFKSKWTRVKAGINLAHLGVLIMLIGGLLTALSSKEGFIVIPEGQSSAYISDYHQRELLIVRDEIVIGKIPHQEIKAGKTIKPPHLPFDINVLDHCKNCEIIKREDSAEEFDKPVAGLASFMALRPKPAEKEHEANLYGATLQIGDETHIAFEAMPKPISIETENAAYEIIYGKAQRTLPFSLKLENFERQNHPGTAMAKSYHSDIVVEDEGSSWPVRIEMNKPLRYKGYTFFQSSFAEKQGEQATVLSVVKNKGWLFPYISTAIIAIGLLLHTVIISRTRKRGAA